jgi:hypothetical protein
LIAIVILANVASVFISNYFKRRAETYATKSDFDELLRQLRTTTEAAESVKSVIAKNDWAEREWRTLRRVKLEELMSAMHATTHWLDQELDGRFFDAAMPAELSPIWKIEVLPSLYFAELQTESKLFEAIFREYRCWIIDVQEGWPGLRFFSPKVT